MAYRGSGRLCTLTALAAVLATKTLFPGLISASVTTESDRRCPFRLHTLGARTGLTDGTWSLWCWPFAETRCRRRWALADTLSWRCRHLVHDTATFPAAIAICIGVGLRSENGSRRPSSRYCSAPSDFSCTRIPTCIRTIGV